MSLSFENYYNRESIHRLGEGNREQGTGEQENGGNRGTGARGDRERAELHLQMPYFWYSPKVWMQRKVKPFELDEAIMTDYIPKGNDSFKAWAAQFINYASNNTAALGITADDFTQLTQEQAQWQTAFDNYMALQASLSQSRQEAKNARDRLEKSLRRFAQWLQHNPKITDVHRLGLGITVPDTSKTSVVAIPTTAPVVQVDLSKRFEHIINFADKETPNRKTKPKGVTGCEIWVKIGDNLPKDANELRLLNVARTTPFNAKYSGNEAGKMAHYMLRWVTGRGEPGPWSQTYSFTIPG